jgi:hypothetical protein
LQALEKRVFIESGELPSSVCDIQNRVAEFKNKLQVCFHDNILTNYNIVRKVFLL